MQLRSSRATNTSADLVNAASFSRDQTDQQTDLDLPSAAVRNTAADSVSDSSSRDQTDREGHPELLSAFITSAQIKEQQQAFEATEAVLGIPELLLLIIAEVPIDCRTSIRRVSKTWEAAVNKVGHTLEPLGYDTIAPYPIDQGFSTDLQNVHCVPVYPVTEESRRRVLKPNRRAGLCNLRIHVFGKGLGSLGIEKLHLVQRHPKKLIKHKNEFMTDPPITQVLVQGALVHGKGPAILRVPGGIRIGDLLETPGTAWFGWERLNLSEGRSELLDARGNYV